MNPENRTSSIDESPAEIDSPLAGKFENIAGEPYTAFCIEGEWAFSRPQAYPLMLGNQTDSESILLDPPKNPIGWKTPNFSIKSMTKP